MAFMKLLLLTTCALFAGCVATYQHPSSSSKPSTLDLTQSSAAFINYFPNGEDCSGKVAIPNEFRPSNPAAKALPVPAGKEIAVAQVSSYGFPVVTSCNVTISFVPKEGMRYRAFFARGGNGCTGSIQKFDSITSAWVNEENSRQRKPKQPFIETGSFCE